MMITVITVITAIRGVIIKSLLKYHGCILSGGGLRSTKALLKFTTAAVEFYNSRCINKLHVAFMHPNVLVFVICSW